MRHIRASRRLKGASERAAAKECHADPRCGRWHSAVVRRFTAQFLPGDRTRPGQRDPTFQGRFNGSVSALRLEHDAVVEVRDTGDGIPRSGLRISASRSDTPKSHLVTGNGGAGLGLSISMGLMRVMGGSLSIESEVGVGTDGPAAAARRRSAVERHKNGSVSAPARPPAFAPFRR